MSASDFKWEKTNILGHLSLAEGSPQQILNDLRDDGQITSGPLLRTRNPLGYFVAASRKALLPWLYCVHHPQGEFRDNEQLQALERQIYSLINVQVKTGRFVYPERGIWCGTHPLHNQQKFLPRVLKVKNNISVIKEILDFIHLCTNTIIPRKPKYLPDEYCKDLSKSIFFSPAECQSVSSSLCDWQETFPFPADHKAMFEGVFRHKWKPFLCIEL